MNGRRSIREAREGTSASLAAAGSARSAWNLGGVALLALATLPVAQGCATGNGKGLPTVQALRAARRTVPVYVESSYVGPVVIYAQGRGTMRVRLGMVSGATPVRLSLPPDLVGGGRYIWLIARPVGSSREAVTDEFEIERGDHIDWRLLSPIETSIATLRIAIGPRR